MLANGELSDRELKVSSWWVTHKTLLHRIFIGFLVVFCVVVWVGSLIRWVALGLDCRNYRAVLLSLASAPTPIAAIRQQRLPVDLLVESAAFVPAGGTRRYDFVATIRNPNERWLVQNMTVAFSAGGREYPVEQTFFILRSLSPR